MLRHSSKAVAREVEQLLASHPFGPLLRDCPDLQASEDLLRQVIPLRQLAPRGDGEDWWHTAINVSLGKLVLTAGVAGPGQGVLESQRHLTLCVLYDGDIQVRQNGCHLSGGAGQLLLLSGEGCRCVTGTVGAIALRLDPLLLQAAAQAMAGRSLPPDRWRPLLERSQLWSPEDGGQLAPLQAALRQLFVMAARLLPEQATLLECLHLDDQIYRLVALLLLPELWLERPIERLRHRQSEGQDDFDELIDSIEANLGDALTLTELEDRSGYSRRALQYAFHERLGCTAAQWIRRQRLDQAQGRLQQPLPGDTVSSIALACGYRSLSLFSLDFQQRFHIKPSQVLRESRASLPPELH